MSRIRHRKEKGPPRYVMLHHWLMNTDAWKDLDGNSRAIYLEICKRYNGVNNGRIGYSVRQAAEDVNISPPTASRCIKSLISHGFIAAQQKGSFSYKMDAAGRRKRLASEWRLTAYGNDVATDTDSQLNGSKDFTRWSEIQNTVSWVKPVVQLVKPYGANNETMRAEILSPGATGETIKARIRG